MQALGTHTIDFYTAVQIMQRITQRVPDLCDQQACSKYHPLLARQYAQTCALQQEYGNALADVHTLEVSPDPAAELLIRSFEVLGQVSTNQLRRIMDVFSPSLVLDLYPTLRNVPPPEHADDDIGSTNLSLPGPLLRDLACSRAMPGWEETSGRTPIDDLLKELDSQTYSYTVAARALFHFIACLITPEPDRCTKKAWDDFTSMFLQARHIERRWMLSLMLCLHASMTEKWQQQ